MGGNRAVRWTYEGQNDNSPLSVAVARFCGVVPGAPRSIEEELLELPRYECVRRLSCWPREKVVSLLETTTHIELVLASLKALGGARSAREVRGLLSLVAPRQTSIFAAYPMRCQALVEIHRVDRDGERDSVRIVTSHEMISSIVIGVINAVDSFDCARLPLTRLLTRMWLHRIPGFAANMAVLQAFLSALLPKCNRDETKPTASGYLRFNELTEGLSLVEAVVVWSVLKRALAINAH